MSPISSQLRPRGSLRVASLLLTLCLSLVAARAARAQEGYAPALTPEQIPIFNEGVKALKTANQQIKAGETDAAFKSTVLAEEKAKALGDAAMKLWLGIARAYHQLNAITRADAAIAHAGKTPEAETTRAHLLRSRRLYGLTPGGSISADAEPAFIKTIDKLNKDLADKKLVPAEYEAALKTYPNAPALLMIDCETKLRKNKRPAAEKLCREALAGAPELSRAHYLLGLSETDSPRREDGAKHLEKALELDPDDVGTWKALADLYRKSQRKKDLAELGEKYQKKFNTAL
jgi:tetratricopeptide (TPR) repeat protein